MLSFAAGSLIKSTLLFGALALCVASVSFVLGAPASGADSQALKVISDQDQSDMQQVKYHIANEYSEFKTIPEVLSFLEKVRLLSQKHPRNSAFAQGDLKDLYKFLSQESINKLNRFDESPFLVPMNDDKIPQAQRAIEEDELARKLFAGPLRSLVESRRQQNLRTEDGNHKDGNFFSNFWCKLTNCSNQ